MTEYTDNLQEINIDDLYHFYKNVSKKNGLTVENVKDIFCNSTYSVFALKDSRIAGFLRAISDDVEWTFISEVSVQKEYGELGIEDELIKRALKRFKGHEIFVVSDKANLGLYEELGFKRSKNAFTYEGYNADYDLKQPKEEFYLPLGYEYDIEHLPFAGSFPVGKKSSIDISKTEIVYDTKFDNPDFEAINALLIKAFGGSDRDINATKKAFKNSRYFAFAYIDKALVGCARAVSDKNNQALILNVAVDPEYQGLHIGQKVVDLLCSQMKGQNIFLNTHPGGVGFYNRKPYLRNKTALLYPAHPDMPEEIAKGFVLSKGFRFDDEQ